MPQTPPALPPNVSAPNSNNNFTPQQEQVVNVTPSEVNPNLEQSQNSTSSGIGSANATSAPVISGQSYNSNTQYNSGYGENTRECMENVGCRDVPQLNFEAYYGRSDIKNSSSNGFYDSNAGAYADNKGILLRFQVPLGNGFQGNLDKLAAEEVAKRAAEKYLLEQQLIAESLKTDREVIQSCVSLKNEINGKSVTIDETSASPVVQRINTLCKGLDVIIAQRESNNDELEALKLENKRMRELILRMQNTGTPVKVGN